MSFRACSYFQPIGVPVEKAVGFRSERVNTEKEADALLEALLAIPGKWFIGGHIEQHVPGVGWVFADQAEAVIIRQQLDESDRECNNVISDIPPRTLNGLPST